MRSITRIVLWGCFLFAQNTSDTVLGKDEFTIRVTDAETTLNNLAKDNLERQKKDDYYRVHIALGNTNRIPTDMTVAEKTMVDSVSTSETEISYNAKAFLHFWFNEQYQPDVAVLSSGSNKMAISENTEEMNEQSPFIVRNESTVVSSLYPNPNDGNMKMDYIISDNLRGKLIVYDITGRIVEEVMLIGNGQLQISRNKFSEGVYLYEVLVNDALLFKDKLIIIK